MFSTICEVQSKNLLLAITQRFHVCRYLITMAESICSLHICLTASIRLMQLLISCLRSCQLAISEHFGHAWICLTTPNKNDIIYSLYWSLNVYKKWRQSLDSLQRCRQFLFWSTLGMHDNIQPKWQSVSRFHGCLTLCKKLRQFLDPWDIVVQKIL